MDILGFLTLTVVGFTSCAEFASYAFVHPVMPPSREVSPAGGARASKNIRARDAPPHDALGDSLCLLRREPERY